MLGHQRAIAAPKLQLLALFLSWILLVPPPFTQAAGAFTNPPTVRTRRSPDKRPHSRQPAAPPSPSAASRADDSRSGQLLVRFRADVSEAERELIVRGAGARFRPLRGASGLVLLTYQDTDNLRSRAAALASNPAVEFAEPNYLIKADEVAPNDARFAEQWALRNTGQGGGQAGADIGITGAWERTTGSARTVIAVIDSGIDFAHPELQANRWNNRAERNNKRDDDGNGLINDFNGWDFVADSNAAKDEHGHGTSVAGIIAAQGNNGTGIAGVMWSAALMDLRVLDGNGTGDIASAVEAIDYAVANGAQVINLSWGTEHESESLGAALVRAAQGGVLVVCSAGNDGRNIDGVRHYPASFDLANVVAVASTDQHDQLTSWSNWGSVRAALAAPGTDILTTGRDGGYQLVSGSSFSAPFVTGVAGLVRTLRPKLSVGRTREMLTRGARPLAFLEGKVASGGVLSATGALGAVESLSPNEGSRESVENGDAGNNGGNINRDANSPLDGNAQGANDSGKGAPKRGRPGSNLPDLNVVRLKRPTATRARAPIHSTLRNCPPRNPQCNKTGDNIDSRTDTSAVTSAVPSPAPAFNPAQSVGGRFALLSSLERQYRSLFIAALGGEKPYSLTSAGLSPFGLSPLGYGRDVDAYGISDTSAATTGGLLAPLSGDDGTNPVAYAGVLPASFQSNAATFVSQSVPSTMIAGQTYRVSVMMRNTGTTTWTAQSGYRLGSQNPENNGLWRLGRVQIPTTAGPGVDLAFNFDVTAPTTAGTYNFQWRMVWDGFVWFGDFTPNVAVTVNAPAFGGWLDGADCNAIRGWAWDAHRPNTPIEVDIFADGAFLTRVPADQYRADLSGHGNGRHAFSVATPPSLRNNAAHTISARVANTTFLPAGSPALSGSPRTLNACSGGGGSGAPNAPSNLSVTQVSNGQISLGWTAGVGGSSYQVERSAGVAGAYTLLANVSTTGFNDNTVGAGTAYLYRVRAVNGGSYSPYSNVALGTALTFQQASAPEIKAVHFTELRQAVSAVRATAALSTSWPDTISAGGLVRASHVREMRDGLNQALGVLNLAQVSFEDGNLGVGTLIKQTHIDQLRSGSTRASGTGTTSSPNNTAGAGSGSVARLDPRNRTGQRGTDLLSGNFSWDMPLVGLRGRSGLDLSLSLSYNSKVWTKDTSTSAIYFNADNGSPAPGFRLGFPVIQQRFFNPQTGGYSYLLVTPGGERVELRQVGTTSVYEAANSSYLRLTDYSGTMLLQPSDGSLLTFGLIGNEYRCTQIKDRNGNMMSVGYNAQGGINTITDTLARVVTFNYDINHNVISITQTWNTQTHTWATFGYSTRQIQHDFSGVTVVGPQNGQFVNVLSQVSLADGSRYQFDYNAYGQVSKISRYSADDHLLTYSVYDVTSETSDCPRVQTRRDWALDWNNEAEALTNYAYAPDRSWGQMTASDGTLYKEFFATSGWLKGLTMQTEVWAGGVRQKWTESLWTQDDVNLGYQLNPRPTDTYVYDKENNYQRTQIDYYPTTSFSLTKDIKEYAANTTTVLKRTHLDYNLDAAYTNRRIIGLVSATYLYGEGATAGTEELASKVTYDYDETGGERLQNTSQPPTQHDASYSASFAIGRGNLTSTRRWSVANPRPANEPEYVESKTGYNIAGSAIFSIDAAEHKSLISYNDSFSDGVNRNTFAYATATTDPEQVSQPNPQKKLITYHYDIGVVTRTQGISPDLNLFPTGTVQTMVYDAAGRIERINDAVSGAYTRFVYAPGQNWVQKFMTVRDTATENYSIQVFDGAGRTYALASDFPGSTGQYKGQHTIYDVMGRAVRSSNPTEITNTWESAGDDHAGWRYSTQDYDWKGRPTFSMHADGSFNQELSYNGCGCAGGEVVTVRDALGRRRRLYSDVLGRQAKTEQLNPDGSVYRTATNTYNGRDQITRVFSQVGTNGTGQETLMSYDGHGRLLTRKAPIQLSPTVYTHNVDDTVHSVTDARGATNTMTYNARHQVMSMTYTAPTGITPTGPTTFGYDAAGNRVWMDDDSGRVDYQYNALSQLTSETREFAGLSGSYTLGYTYNLTGLVASITDPAGVAVNYTYDGAGQLSGVTGTTFGGVSQYATGMQYRAFGAVKSVAYGNNQSLVQNFNARLQLSSMQVGSALSAEFHYAPDGQIRYAKDNTDPIMDRAYDYDHVGRLSAGLTGAEARDFVFGTQSGVADGIYRQTYQYDVWDNLTGRAVNRFWSQGEPFTATFVNERKQGSSYDAEGNETRDGYGIGGRTHRYDAAGRKVQSSERSKSQAGALLYSPGDVEAGEATAPSAAAASGGDANMSPGGYETTTTLTISQGYDGDGKTTKRVETRVSSTPFYQPVTTVRTDYYVRSSVLKGEVITELNSAGQKAKTYVYAGGEVIAQQDAYAGGEQWLTWKQRNSITGTQVEHNTANGQTYKKEYDPFGRELGDSDPYLNNSEPDYATFAGGSFYRNGGNPFSDDSGCQWNGAPIRCESIGFIARTHYVEWFEVNSRNAPPGFAMGIGAQRRLVEHKEPVYGDHTFEKGVKDDVHYVTTNHHQAYNYSYTLETTVTGYFPQSTASPIWLPGGPDEETKKHINKTIADLVGNKECVKAFTDAGLNDPNKVLNTGYVLASKDSLAALGPNNSYGIGRLGRNLSSNWPGAQAAVTASGPDHISGGRRLTVFSSNNFTAFGAVVDFPFNQYLQESGSRLRAIDFLVLHELVHAAGAPDLGLHDVLDKHFGLSPGTYSKISEACMPIKQVRPPIF